MDKMEFRLKMETASKSLDEDLVKNVVTGAIKKDMKSFEGMKNLIIVMEEFAECSQEVSRYIRGKSDRFNLLEEVADAWLGIKFIQEVCGISDEELNKAINVKLKREKKRTERGGI